ncbi:MAG: hypothetical protein ACRCZP_09850 [Phycicoccus sp.]
MSGWKDWSSLAGGWQEARQAAAEQERRDEAAAKARWFLVRTGNRDMLEILGLTLPSCVACGRGHRPTRGDRGWCPQEECQAHRRRDLARRSAETRRRRAAERTDAA